MHLTPIRQRQNEATRCPYCHDLLAVEALELIECPDCHTEHHRACVSELGGCSVYGCEHSWEDKDFELIPGESPLRHAIRKRMRERVRSYVRRNVRRVEGPTLDEYLEAREELREKLRAALRKAEFERRQQNFEAALEHYSEAVRLEAEATPADLDGLEGWALGVAKGNARRLEGYLLSRWAGAVQARSHPSGLGFLVGLNLAFALLVFGLAIVAFVS